MRGDRSTTPSTGGRSSGDAGQVADAADHLFNHRTQSAPKASKPAIVRIATETIVLRVVMPVASLRRVLTSSLQSSAYDLLQQALRFGQRKAPHRSRGLDESMRNGHPHNRGVLPGSKIPLPGRAPVSDGRYEGSVRLRKVACQGGSLREAAAPVCRRRACASGRSIYVNNFMLANSRRSRPR
jgi:hypothetical protein